MASQELSVTAIKKDLATRFIGRNIIYYPCLTSTMEAARREAQQAAPDGTVIIAGEQTQGRGRMGRTWFSPGGNIALSMLLYPGFTSLPYLIMIASLAAAKSIESVVGLETQIKWPNDILIKGKKVAGILIENEVKGRRVAYSIIGIGINVALQSREVDEISAVATGLEEEKPGDISREDIIRNLLNEFERFYLRLPDGRAIFEEWSGRLVTLGKKVTANWGNESFSGIAESVEESGALNIRLADGRLIPVFAGEVTLREK
jgi:BirA family transcriptional regulator, biotin operon repressor / biotin---[acetyl-CoA-carboxylase] ligase